MEHNVSSVELLYCICISKD